MFKCWCCCCYCYNYLLQLLGIQWSDSDSRCVMMYSLLQYEVGIWTHIPINTEIVKSLLLCILPSEHNSATVNLHDHFLLENIPDVDLHPHSQVTTTVSIQQAFQTVIKTFSAELWVSLFKAVCQTASSETIGEVYSAFWLQRHNFLVLYDDQKTTPRRRKHDSAELVKKIPYFLNAVSSVRKTCKNWSVLSVMEDQGFITATHRMDRKPLVHENDVSCWLYINYEN